jgi:hypothetical protein
MIGLCGMGTSYASWVNAHSIVQNMSTKKMDFMFTSGYDDDFSIKLDYNPEAVTGSAITSEKLDAMVKNTGKTLTVSGMEPVDMKKLLSGEAFLNIEYQLKTSDINNGLLSVADGTYDLGVIPFKLSVDEPYWKICNENGNWGVGETEDSIPKAAYDLIPESLGELHGYNTVKSNQNGIVLGSILIKQLKPVTIVNPTIDLTSLKLSDEMNLEIAPNQTGTSNLEIMANYNFNIFFILEQANSK